MTVRAVLFDWGGTLTPWHGDIDVRAEWQAYAAAWQGDDLLVESLLHQCEAAWQRSREDHTSASIESIAEAAGLDPADERHTAGLIGHQEFWKEHTFTDPLVRPTWEALRDMGIRIGVLSNTLWTGGYHRAIFERDGVAELIDGEVYSSEIPWTKPHPQAFRAAADAVGVAVAESVYVGDRLFEDVHGAQGAGMRAIWVPHSDIPVAQRVETGATPDAVAQEISDVVRIVREWNASGQ
ncbi:HAD family hydrolase [Calidifontibacter sp. DB0510]|uniref:HAD family hydrolase n=1 Tax=Metallococcus carri TaxID=1656884 RepID=A0A967AWL8_9MICO|nr:HAD family hydrolase [Metallococcus carri]NHN54291.1 HAD family hydrolase [Metallococcus carri]NOP36869.1 HAD family hydrolase [Calidifontibacter sp. DB2511S]